MDMLRLSRELRAEVSVPLRGFRGLQAVGFAGLSVLKAGFSPLAGF